MSFVGVVPLSIGASNNSYEVDAVKDHPKQNGNADTNSVGRGYFNTMGIPLLRGRDFVPSTDDQHSVIINETMASHMFPGQDPIGRVIRQDKEQYTVIGVTRNSKIAHHWREAAGCDLYVLECCSGKVRTVFRNHADREDIGCTRRNSSFGARTDWRARSQYGGVQYSDDARTRRQIAAAAAHLRTVAGDLRRGWSYTGRLSAFTA